MLQQNNSLLSPLVQAHPQLAPGLALLALGMMVILAVGFAGPEVIHNAAHDARHAFAFPCH